MKKFTYLWVFCCLLFTLDVNIIHAQNKYIDTSYIEPFEKKYSLRILMEERAFSLEFIPVLPDSVVKPGIIDYHPNVNEHLGIAGSFKNIRLTLLFKLPGTNKDETIYGTTDYFTFEGDAVIRMFNGHAHYNHYQGFYLDQANRFFPVKFLQRKDIEYRSIGLGLTYIFNFRKYSLNAVLKQTEQQKRNAGTPLLSIGLDKKMIDSDSSLIPKDFQEYFGPLSEFSATNTNLASISGGYSYILMFKKNFYLAPLAKLGVGIKKDKINKSEDFEEAGAFFKANMELHAGYNAKRILSGIHIMYDVNSLPVGQMNINSDKLLMRVFAGLRF